MRALIFCLLSAAAWGGEASSSPRLLSFQMTEMPQALVKVFRGDPHVVSQPSFRVLQFHDGADHTAAHSCDGDFEWEFFYSSAGEMQSITWNAKAAVPVRALFPPKDRAVYSTETGGMRVTVLLRRLPGERVLVANVQDPAQAEISQAVLMRSDAVKRFLPWLADSISHARK